MSNRDPGGGGPVAAVLFEPYGTLVDIETDERDWYAYVHLARFLEYRGVRVSADELRWLWFEQIARQLGASTETYPEIDVRAAWQALLAEKGAACRTAPDLEGSSFIADLTRLHRALTRRSLGLMDGARPLLEALSSRVRLAVVADNQPDYLLPELEVAGIARYFEAVAISGARGYRKPDPRLFGEALAALGVAAEQALFVGVDTGRDIAGAHAAGMRSVLVLSPYGSKDIALGEPDFVVDRTADIAAVLGPLLTP